MDYFGEGFLLLSIFLNLGIDFLITNKYNEFVVINKWGDKMSPQMGRPKSENPRKKQLGVRFDDEELRKLDEVAEHYNETRVESIRRGVEKLYSEIKK